jgi:hypothetical protein
MIYTRINIALLNNLHIKKDRFHNAVIVYTPYGNARAFTNGKIMAKSQAVLDYIMKEHE